MFSEKFTVSDFVVITYLKQLIPTLMKNMNVVKESDVKVP